MRQTKSYANLAVWNDSLVMVKDIYVITASLPDSEQNALLPRIRNTAIDVPSLIIKGVFNYDANKRIEFLMLAQEALHDLETLLAIAMSLNYVTQDDMDRFTEDFDHILSHINGLMRKFQRENKSTDE